MASLLGSIEQFDPKYGDWSEYTERLEQYFLANDINDDKKQTAVFLTVIGSDTYSLLRNLLTPEKPSQKPVEELIQILSEHLNPKPITIAERYKFYQKEQIEGESLGDYIAGLRKASEHCEFGTFLNEALRDKFVCGIIDKYIRKQLLAERDLDIQRAVQLATGFEEANTQNSLMSKNKTQTFKTHLKEENTHKVFSQKHGNPPSQRCFRCLSKAHLANICPYKNYSCRKCRNIGHLAKACRRSAENTNKLEDEQTPESASEEESEVFINNIKGNDAFTIELLVNNKNTKFEIDTGSSITIVSEKDFNRSHLVETTSLERTNTIIKTYSGEKLSVLGRFNAKIEHNEGVYNNFIYVVKGNGSSLLGRDFLRQCKIDWASVNKIDVSLNKLIEKYPLLFSEKLGKMKNFQAKINVKPGSTPKFSKGQKRSICYARSSN